MKSRFLSMAAVLISISAIPAQAHHSMGTYDATTLVTIKGTITKIDWTNPHVRVHLDIRTEDGKTVTRRVELAGPGGLVKRGFDRSLVNIGDAVTFEAWLPRDPRFGDAPNGRNLILADGRQFDVGDNWSNPARPR